MTHTLSDAALWVGFVLTLGALLALAIWIMGPEK